TPRIHKIRQTHQPPSQMHSIQQHQHPPITITSPATTPQSQGHPLNIIHTPPHLHFTVQLQPSLRLLHPPLTLLHPQSPLQPQTQTLSPQPTTYPLPPILFLNKIHKLRPNFQYSLSTLHHPLQADAPPIQLPIPPEDQFQAIIHLLQIKSFKYTNDLPTQIHQI
ncbi:GTP-binding protein, partial [Staphylococcus epidermidis]|uniref:GTP-binding protein n=1 Tax=Staphylococcus epidermidis TaxID=1282 RepID=UPI0021B2861D